MTLVREKIKAHPSIHEGLGRLPGPVSPSLALGSHLRSSHHSCSDRSRKAAKKESLMMASSSSEARTKPGAKPTKNVRRRTFCSFYGCVMGIHIICTTDCVCDAPLGYISTCPWASGCVYLWLKQTIAHIKI